MAMPAAVAPVRQMGFQMAMRRALRMAMQMALQMAAATQSRLTTRSVTSSSSTRMARQTGASQQMAARQMPKQSRLRPSLTLAQVGDWHRCLLGDAADATINNASISLQTCVMLQRHLLTRHSFAFCHAEFPSEALAQRLRHVGKTARFVLALVLLKVVHSGSAYLQARAARLCICQTSVHKSVAATVLDTGVGLLRVVLPVRDHDLPAGGAQIRQAAAGMEPRMGAPHGAASGELASLL